MKTFFYLLLALCCAACAPKKQPVSLIFDTDMAPDYDDVGAMAVLHARLRRSRYPGHRLVE